MSRLRHARRRALLAGCAALAALVLPGAGGAAWTTNLVQLDNGNCGTNLQIGSDQKASSSSRPSFWLQGDGGLSSYAVAIDGSPIGTFYSTGQANVCITTSAALADGPHRLTATELAPHAGWVVDPLDFTVDTVEPAPPSAPSLSAYKDSGALGDGITRFASINLAGAAAPNEPVQVLSGGVTLVGGARADAQGRWSVTTVNLTDGTYSFSARTLDTAGNRSVLSATTRITIDTVAPATPVAPRLDETADGTGNVALGSSARDVSTVRVFSDGGQLGATSPGSRTRAWRYRLPQLDSGSHAIAVSAADAAGNVSPLSSAAMLSVTSPPPPDPEPEPAADPRPTSPPDPAPVIARPPRPTRPS